MRLLLSLTLLVTAHACTDSYPTPPKGQYCDLISGGISDGQNCWGDCVVGCPEITCPAGSTCYMETRPISTQGSCTWPANTKLCCAHIKTTEGEPSYGSVVATNKTKAPQPNDVCDAKHEEESEVGEYCLSSKGCYTKQQTSSGCGWTFSDPCYECCVKDGSTMCA